MSCHSLALPVSAVYLPPAGPAAPSIASAVSRRAHGAAGSFDLPLSMGPVATVYEPRVSGAGAPQVILTFTAPIEAADGVVNCGGEVIVANGTCNSVTISGATMTINMAFTKNRCVAVTVNGIRGAGGGPAMTGATTLSVLTHEGNVTGDDAVNLLDLQAIKLNLFIAKPACP
jgi:hypothetical protein